MSPDETKLCSICGRQYDGYGNNAAPYPGGRCCDSCDNMAVTPIRIAIVMAAKAAARRQSDAS